MGGVHRRRRGELNAGMKAQPWRRKSDEVSPHPNSRPKSAVTFILTRVEFWVEVDRREKTN
jgi:hypothetical protein